MLPSQLIAAGSRLFFAGADRKLWISDGTPAGTRQVGNVLFDDGLPKSTSTPVAVGGKLFFIGNDGSGDRELWVSDGTDASTHRVKDINPAGSASPAYMARLGGGLMFAANTNQLWKSDGTEAGTVLLKDLVIAPAGFEPDHTYGELDYKLIDVDGKLFFRANDRTMTMSCGLATAARPARGLSKTSIQVARGESRI